MKLDLIELVTLKTFFLLASAFCCNISNQIKFLLVGFYETKRNTFERKVKLACFVVSQKEETELTDK